MIKLNNHTGIMEMHNKKRIKPPREELPCDKRQWTMEEMLHWQALKPPSRKDDFKTTAPQRKPPQPKREIDIWKERE